MRTADYARASAASLCSFAGARRACSCSPACAVAGRAPGEAPTVALSGTSLPAIDRGVVAADGPAPMRSRRAAPGRFAATDRSHRPGGRSYAPGTRHGEVPRRRRRRQFGSTASRARRPPARAMPTRPSIRELRRPQHRRQRGRGERRRRVERAPRRRVRPAGVPHAHTRSCQTISSIAGAVEPAADRHGARLGHSARRRFEHHGRRP